MVVIDEIAERIKCWLEGKPQSPYKVDFFFTERCNLKCLFCNFPLVDKERFKKELTKEELFEIVEYCKKNDVRAIGILGGEPFYRKSLLIEVMREIKSCGISGSIVTNGTLLDEKTIGEIVKMGWDLIRFSIDGKESTHDFLRGRKGSFKAVVRAIRKFNYLKRKLKKNNPTLEINTVLCEKNYRELPQLIKLASNLKCNFVYLLPMIEFTEFSERLRISDKGDVKKYLERAKLLAEKLQVRTNFDEIISKGLMEKSNRMKEVILPEEKLKSKSYIPCFLPWYTMSIDALGNATPCCNLAPIGENMREKKLEEIWLGKNFDEIRKRMLRKDLLEECSRCCVPLIDENRMLRERIGEHGKGL